MHAGVNQYTGREPVHKCPLRTGHHDVPSCCSCYLPLFLRIWRQCGITKLTRDVHLQLNFPPRARLTSRCFHGLTTDYVLIRGKHQRDPQCTPPPSTKRCTQKKRKRSPAEARTRSMVLPDDRSIVIPTDGLAVHLSAHSHSSSSSRVGVRYGTADHRARVQAMENELVAAPGLGRPRAFARMPRRTRTPPKGGPWTSTPSLRCSSMSATGRELRPVPSAPASALPKPDGADADTGTPRTRIADDGRGPGSSSRGSSVSVRDGDEHHRADTSRGCCCSIVARAAGVKLVL